MRILVADDMGAMRQTVKRTLNSLGFNEISEAKNGKEAYDAIMAGQDIPGRKIDLAIIDWNMAPISGIELLKTLRADERTKDILFVMLTAEQMRDNILLALQARVDEYIIKPFTAETVKKKFDIITLRELGKIRKEVDDHLASLKDRLEPETAEERKKALGGFRKKLAAAGRISPWSYYALMETGKTLLKFGEADEAEKCFRDVLSKNFGVAEAHKELSRILRDRGKIAESAEELRIASMERPDSGEIKQKLGEAYLKEGRLDEAIDVLSDSLKLLEESRDKRLLARGRSGLGEARMKKGEKDGDEKMRQEALEDFGEAARLDPDLVAASYNLMVACKKAGMTEKAMEIFKSIQEMEPKDAEGWIALGKAYLDQDEKSKALFAFRKAEDLSEGRFPVYEEISKALYHARIFDEALAYLDKAKEINPSGVFSYNLAGIIHRMRDESAKALKEYQKASKLDPDNPSVYFNLGVAYYKLGDGEKSTEQFRKAKGLDPDLPELASYMEKLGIA
ncbi:MAG: tetratricopeptide repeat protein [Candidatus Nitrospinota bacterium M3_3B_026]